MFGIRSAGRQFATALRALIVATIVLGVAYPLVITGASQLALPSHANGSLVAAADAPVGSALIGQSFTDADGNALPQYFQSRPSAVGYDAASSGGSNLGPENPDLVAQIAARISAVAALDGVSRDPSAGRRGHGLGVGPRSSHQPRVRSRAGKSRRRGARPGPERCAQPRRREHGGSHAGIPRRANRECAQGEYRP